MTAKIDAAALDALFAPFDHTDAPGFAVGVALKGKSIYRRGFGMASVELPVALSPTMRMRIGSTSKHFCVLAVMLLVEEGRLSLDDSPRRHLPQLPDWAEPMTVRQLMAHTSGMRDSLDLIFQTTGPGLPSDPDAQLKMLAGLDSVNFPAGTSWNYNNGGYALLSEIVERLSGQKFGAFLKERILDPIGMNDTLLRPLDTELVQNSATNHVPLPGGGWSRGVFGPHISGEGALVSTVDDMLRWLRHMSNPTVGTTETWTQMRTSLTTHGYGLGLMIDTHRGLHTVHHAGGVIGGSSQMLKVLDHELDIILMTNGQSALDLYNLVDAIIEACIPDLSPAARDEGGEAIGGTFHSPATGRVLTLVEHEGQQAMTIGGMTLPARRDADGVITVAILPTDLRVKPVSKGGEVSALEATEFGVTDRLERVEPPPGAEPPTGRWENRAAGIAATIKAGQFRLRGPLGGTTYGLEPIGPDLWQTTTPSPMGIGGTLEFGADGSFLFTSGRTVRLAFVPT